DPTPAHIRYRRERNAQPRRPRSALKSDHSLMLRFSALLLTLAWAALAVEPVRWTPEMANEWYSKLPWTVGVNYIPASASNQLEMWQNNTFDPAVIDTELG